MTGRESYTRLFTIEKHSSRRQDFRQTHPSAKRGPATAFVKQTGSSLRRTPRRGPTCSVWSFRCKVEEDRAEPHWPADRRLPRDGYTPGTGRSYAAWRV